jgi:hypothetical protein
MCNLCRRKELLGQTAETTLTVKKGLSTIDIVLLSDPPVNAHGMVPKSYEGPLRLMKANWLTLLYDTKDTKGIRWPG